MKIEYVCVDGSIYNPKTTLCELGIKCYSFIPQVICKGNIGAMINHPTVKNYFVYCGTEPVLFKCSIESFMYSKKTGNCNYVCTKLGRFADPREGMEQWYFECSENDEGNLITTHKRCPGDTVFDPEIHSCKPRER